MALNKSLNHSYFLVKFVAESKIQFKIVNSTSVVSCNYSSLDENIFIKFSDMIYQCSVVCTSNSVPDLEYKIPGLREKVGFMDFVDEEVKPDVNHLIEIEEEIMVDEDVKPDVNHLVKIKEEVMIEEDVTPDVNYHYDNNIVETMSTKRKRTNDIIDNIIDRDYINGDQYDDENDPTNEEGMRRCDEEPSIKKSKRLSTTLQKTDKFSSSDDDEKYISFGPNGTSIKEWDYNLIKWDSYKLATRGLLMAVFGKKILSTHCLSGKQRLGYVYETPTSRPQLDVKKVEDVISIVSEKCEIVNISLIRHIIVQKCSDERRTSKMIMKRMTKLTGNL